jgi:hypothetical protein
MDDLMSTVPERRAHVRLEVDQAVTIGPLGEPPVAGTLVNISLGGAAILMHDWDAAWLSRLNQSDELWLSGFFDVPASCRVVVTDGDVLRVHFAADDALRRQIHDIISRPPSR